MRTLIVIAICISVVSWLDVGGKLVMPERAGIAPRSDYSKTTVKLEGEGLSFITYPYSSGLFKFTNIPTGNYIMTIDDVEYFYESVAVEVYLHKDKEVIRTNIYDIKNGKGSIVKHPVYFSPVGPKIYDEIKEAFSFVSLLKNPMIIMMLVSVGLVFLMNKMPKPDKEQMAEMNKQMGSVKMPSFLSPN